MPNQKTKEEEKCEDDQHGNNINNFGYCSSCQPQQEEKKDSYVCPCDCHPDDEHCYFCASEYPKLTRTQHSPSIQATDKAVPSNVEEILRELEEYGGLHDEDCDVNDEGGSYDGCHCSISGMKNFVLEVIAQVQSSIAEDIQALIIKRMNKYANTKLSDRQNAFKELHELNMEIDKIKAKYLKG